MLVYAKQSWFRLVFTLRGTALVRAKWRVIAAVAWAMFTTYYLHIERWSLDLTSAPFTFVGLAISIFLGFRNTASYDRFWEGRKLWGQIINSTRNASRLILATVTTGVDTPESRERHRRYVHRLIGWAVAVQMHLRDQRELEQFAGLLSPEEIASLAKESNPPMAVMQNLSNELGMNLVRGELGEVQHLAIETQLSVLIDALGGCERIKNTPLPFSYAVLLHQIVAAYCFALPFGIAHSVGMATPVVVAFVAYAFLGLDAVGDEIEDPFGFDPNDLPLLSICRTIEINLRERLGETEIPPKRAPVDHVLA